MSKLNDFRLLSFDVYGTLIDWETGILDSLRPILLKNNQTCRNDVLAVVHGCENEQMKKTPDMKYSELLNTIHPHICQKLECVPPTAEESQAFSQRIGMWPAFPDTVDALQRLSKHYKLVVLSNVDNESFAYTNEGPLEKFAFDAILTAEDIGSYKPDPRNFEYLFKYVKEHFDIEKNCILHTAQSQHHDHHAIKPFGVKSSWIARQGARTGDKGDEVYDWKFYTLGEMADALEKELESQSL
ncbi:HAD-like protein [Lindgomyces ingoldianus]|uniref:HAD-like protein n=1 Tax=Lindgomyces ingoldianus TaxID=673940 RepID=A0ACB6QH33_9PLEO|nr:HAD-like protein [Lindgomyces ingoldianus]KAF2465672.1 HAD-like protein [Lindgomyces ingoldianus]